MPHEEDEGWMQRVANEMHPAKKAWEK